MGGVVLGFFCMISFEGFFCVLLGLLVCFLSAVLELADETHWAKLMFSASNGIDHDIIINSRNNFQHRTMRIAIVRPILL